MVFRFASSCLLLVLLSGFSADAQPLEVRWDSLAGSGQTIIVQPGPGGPFADTVFAVSAVGSPAVYRLSPGDTSFEPVLKQSFPTNGYFGRPYHVTQRGTHLSNANRFVFSEDGGATWEAADMLFEGESFGHTIVSHYLESDEHGLLAVGIGGVFWKSADDGRTWVLVSNLDLELAGRVNGLTELAGDTRTGDKPSPCAGRLLLTIRNTEPNGLRFSDDGGTTWEAASGLDFGQSSWKHFAEGPGCTVYAHSGHSSRVAKSTDGGKTWQELIEFGRVTPVPLSMGFASEVAIAVGPEGAVWVGITAPPRPPHPGGMEERPRLVEGTFMYSDDGGQTWSEAADGFGRYGVTDIEFDSAGRLIAATEGGIWRTAEPVAFMPEPDTP